MCGIVGFLDPALIEPGAAAVVLARMRGAIRHRGPDDDGQIADGGVGLGIQRLSIVDLVCGHQPMTSADGRIWLVFNGEIYNHAELRSRLESFGRSFRTHSDTEVILAQYERFGLDGVRDFNGMFAFAIWDGRSRELHVVRDRLGVKPLYYHFDGGRLIFGSELKAVLAGLPARPDVNGRAIWDFLTLRFVPAPHTIWNGIFKLPPAHHLTISFEHLEPVIERYWDIPASPPRPSGSDHELVARFGELLRDAVQLRMLADVPVGILLSGGLDSSVVAALAARESTRLTTFSVAFAGEPEIDETPYARLMSRHLGTNHAEIFIGAREFCDFLPEFVYYTDEPLADLASIPLYYVCRLARQSVKVVLSGEGSDEILGGYSFDVWVRRWNAARRERTRGARWLRAVAGPLVPSLHEAESSVDLDLRRAPVPLSMTNYLTSDEKRSLLRAPSPWPDSLDGMRAALERLGDSDTLDQALYVYCQDWLVEDLLMKADKMSMANSVELRTPFLDYRVVEYAARLPEHLKVGADRSGTYRTKVALREIARGLVPESIIARAKQGFPVPVYGWLSTVLRSWAQEILSDPSGRLRDWCDPKLLRAALVAGTDERASMTDRHRLWHLLVLEIWLRRWLPKDA